MVISESAAMAECSHKLPLRASHAVRRKSAPAALLGVAVAPVLEDGLVALGAPEVDGRGAY
jgi:hypothetical protein